MLLCGCWERNRTLCKSSKSVSSLQFFSPSMLGEVAFENWNSATDHICDLFLYSLLVMKNKCTASHREQRQVLSQGTWSLSVASERLCRQLPSRVTDWWVQGGEGADGKPALSNSPLLSPSAPEEDLPSPHKARL